MKGESLFVVRRTGIHGEPQKTPIREAIKDVISNGDDPWDSRNHLEDKVSRLTEAFAQVVEHLAENDQLPQSVLESIFPWSTEFVWEEKDA